MGEDATRLLRTLPEPARDVAAQLRAVLDPRSVKDAVYLAPGTPEPDSAGLGLHRVARADGVLLTSNPSKAEIFRRAPALTEHALALLLDYPESKDDVRRAGGEPVVVQGVAPDGGIAYEAAASRAHVARTVRAAQAAVPDGFVRLTDLRSALEARATTYCEGS